MKLATTYENGQIFQHFGKTQQFKIYDIQEGKVGFSMVTSTGGQGDYVRGAQLAKGGKSFLAFKSTLGVNPDGSPKSRIVPYFPPATIVTTPRSDVQYVVTEYGEVNLKTLTMRDRTRALIGLAHPDCRPELTAQAKKMGIL